MVNDQIRFDEPRSGVQRLAARFGGHAYDTHRHETYGVGLTLWGAQSFHYRGALRTSRGGQVMVLHPDEAHDGHATGQAILRVVTRGRARSSSPPSCSAPGP